MPYNLSLTVFTQINFVANFFSIEVRFYTENAPFLRFWAPHTHTMFILGSLESA